LQGGVSVPIKQSGADMQPWITGRRICANKELLFFIGTDSQSQDQTPHICAR
jgi:hypothetical protein